MATVEQRLKDLENERELLWGEVRALRERIARTWEALADQFITGWLPFSLYHGSRLPPFAAGSYGSFSTVYAVSADKVRTVIRWAQACYVATTNDGSHYWQLRIVKTDGVTNTTMATINTSALSPNTWNELEATSFSNGDIADAIDLISIQIQAVGSPGSLSCGCPAVFVK